MLGATTPYNGCAYESKPNFRSVRTAGSSATSQEWLDGSIHVRHERAGSISVIRPRDRVRPERRPASPPHVAPSRQSDESWLRAFHVGFRNRLTLLARFLIFSTNG